MWCRCRRWPVAGRCLRSWSPIILVLVVGCVLGGEERQEVVVAGGQQVVAAQHGPGAQWGGGEAFQSDRRAVDIGGTGAGDVIEQVVDEQSQGAGTGSVVAP